MVGTSYIVHNVPHVTVHRPYACAHVKRLRIIKKCIGDFSRKTLNLREQWSLNLHTLFLCVFSYHCSNFSLLRPLSLKITYKRWESRNFGRQLGMKSHSNGRKSFEIRPSTKFLSKLLFCKWLFDMACSIRYFSVSVYADEIKIRLQPLGSLIGC